MDDEPHAVSAPDHSGSDSPVDAGLGSQRSTTVAILVVGVRRRRRRSRPLGCRGPSSSGESIISNGGPVHRVVFENGRGETVGVFGVRVAETHHEQAQGLSGTDTLPVETGLLSAYDEEAADRAIVMRDMNHPVDVVFVDGSGTVTAVHSATPEPGVGESDLTRYTGHARWVLELSHQTAERHPITPGTSVRITEPTHTFESTSASVE